jgi:hypothetical protein
MIVPFLPLLGVVLAVGWTRLLRTATARPAAAQLLLAAIPPAGVWQDASPREWRGHKRVRARGYEIGHAALARFLRDEAAKPGDTIALMDIGIVGYLCDRQTILDVTGLTDRHIGKSPGRFLQKEYDPAYVFGRRPEFLVLVLGALGDPERPIPGGTALRAATPMETKLWAHPELARSYRERAPRPAGGSWVDGLAVQLGAWRIFEHRHPGSYYLLALYRRQQ